MSRLSIIALCTASLASPAFAQHADDRVLRIYDLRDLATQSTYTVALRPTIQPLQDGGSSETAAITVRPVFQSEASEVFQSLADLSNLASRPVGEGLIAAVGRESEHDQFTAALAQFRALNGDRYTVELTAYEVAGEVNAPPGAPADGFQGDVLFRSRQTVSSRSTVKVQATTSTTFISGWSPVVSDHAIGYQVQTSVAEDGFSGALLLGHGTDGGVRAGLSGWILDTEIESRTLSLNGSELPLATPRRRERAIQSDVSAPLDVPTVLATVSGFAEGRSIVVIVKIGAAENP